MITVFLGWLQRPGGPLPSLRDGPKWAGHSLGPCACKRLYLIIPETLLAAAATDWPSMQPVMSDASCSSVGQCRTAVLEQAGRGRGKVERPYHSSGVPFTPSAPIISSIYSRSCPSCAAPLSPRLLQRAALKQHTRRGRAGRTSSTFFPAVMP